MLGVSHTHGAHFSRTEACSFTLYHQWVNYQEKTMHTSEVCTQCALLPTHTPTTNISAFTQSFLSGNHFGRLKLLPRFYLLTAAKRLGRNPAPAVQMCVKTHDQQAPTNRGWCSPSQIKFLVGQVPLGQGLAGIITRAGVSRNGAQCFSGHFKSEAWELQLSEARCQSLQLYQKLLLDLEVQWTAITQHSPAGGRLRCENMDWAVRAMCWTHSPSVCCTFERWAPVRNCNCAPPSLSCHPAQWWHLVSLTMPYEISSEWYIIIHGTSKAMSKIKLFLAKCPGSSPTPRPHRNGKLRRRSSFTLISMYLFYTRDQEKRSTGEWHQSASTLVIWGKTLFLVDRKNHVLLGCTDHLVTLGPSAGKLFLSC